MGILDARARKRLDLGGGEWIDLQEPTSGDVRRAEEAERKRGQRRLAEMKPSVRRDILQAPARPDARAAVDMPTLIIACVAGTSDPAIPAPLTADVIDHLPERVRTRIEAEIRLLMEPPSEDDVDRD